MAVANCRVAWRDEVLRETAICENRRVSAKTCPILQAHGDVDEIVDIGQMHKMKAALDEAGVENESIVVKGAGHTFDLEKWCGKPLSEDVRSRVIAFFDRHLKHSENASAPSVRSATACD